MSKKTLVIIGMSLGSLAGGYLPSLWGEDIFSMWSLLLSAAGAMLGIWLGYKLGDS